MRNELLQQRAKEVREENNINNDMMISSIFENKETEPDVEIEEQEQNDNTENINKNILEKQKKLLEKISYEANVYKKDGKLEEYEKKLIEGLAIEPDNLDFNKQLADLYFTV
jgi:hypothetical protein